jgi:adhesin/invasin
MKFFIKIVFFLILLPSFGYADVKSKALNKASSIVNSKTTTAVGNFLNEHFPTSEFTLSSGLTNRVKGGVLVVRPLSDPSNITNTIFTQGSLYFSGEGRKTLNLGLGDRFLTLDNKLLLGANIFYDHEFPYDHGRTSLGLEAKSSVGEINYNKYFRHTSWKKGKGDVQEKALDGQDFELGVPLPYLPWAKIYSRKFYYDAGDGVEDLKGDDFKLSAELPYGIGVEIGKRSYSSTGQEDQEFINVTWSTSVGRNKDASLFELVSDEAYQLTSVEDKRYDKVRRENLIVKQRSGELSIKGF